jgi:polyisoprenyl-phosphate glycosyltransferase
MSIPAGAGSPLAVSVVLPCYNERDHVELDIKRISVALLEAGLSCELICVDAPYSQAQPRPSPPP